MAHGFYELLGVDPAAPADELRVAYQRRLAELVRRLRAARRQGADVRILEGQERDLREAMEVLQSATRRRSYDAFRAAVSAGLPESAEALWEQARRALVDPLAHGGLAAVRALTDLPVGDPLPEPMAGAGAPTRRAPVRRAEVVPLPAPAPPPPVAAPVVEIEDDDEVGLHVMPRLTDVAPWAPEVDLTETMRVRVVGSNSNAGMVASAAASVAVRMEEEGDEVDRLLRRYGMDGRFLKGVRESRNMAVEDLSRATRISTRYLSAIEDNAFDKLPAATFVRGYMKQIAEVLGVADRGVVEGFMALYSNHRG
jgi:hypothetical protein